MRLSWIIFLFVVLHLDAQTTALQLRPGETAQVTFSLVANSNGSNIATLRWNNTTDGRLTGVAGIAPTSIACDDGFLSCIVFAGDGSQPLPEGIVGVGNLTVPEDTTANEIRLVIDSIVASDADGNVVPVDPGIDATIQVLPLLSQCSHDLNGDGVCDVKDLAVLVNDILNPADDTITVTIGPVIQQQELPGSRITDRGGSCWVVLAGADIYSGHCTSVAIRDRVDTTGVPEWDRVYP